MGIRPYKAFTFDGESSLDYGVYLTGEGVFNAPERAVEMIEIPGRNGNYALDQGRFQNISLTYRAGLVDYSEADFATRMSAVRNWLCSKIGYCRLEDDYNTGEYRIAVYMSGVEVDHDDLQTGEFDITFDCKPQRFLTSGETETAVANNGTINNPTRFDARPILKVQGYGNIGMNSDTISIKSIPLGQILLANGANFYIDYPYYTSPLSTDYIGSQIIDSNKLAAGDTFTMEQSSFEYMMTATMADEYFMEATATNQSGSGASTAARIQDNQTGVWTTTINPITFTKGTSATVTHTYSLKYKYGSTEQTYTSGTLSITISIAYDGANEISLTATKEVHYGTNMLSGTGFLNSISGYSTLQITGTITVDLDIGTAYWDNSGTMMDANNAVSFGNKLPVLNPGVNTITYPNTLTSFKVIPNWWKV